MPEQVPLDKENIARGLARDAKLVFPINLEVYKDQ